MLPLVQEYFLLNLGPKNSQLFLQNPENYLETREEKQEIRSFTRGSNFESQLPREN
jgi:hypothetical protein